MEVGNPELGQKRAWSPRSRHLAPWLSVVLLPQSPVVREELCLAFGSFSREISGRSSAIFALLAYSSCLRGHAGSCWRIDFSYRPVYFTGSCGCLKPDSQQKSFRHDRADP